MGESAMVFGFLAVCHISVHKFIAGSLGEARVDFGP